MNIFKSNSDLLVFVTLVISGIVLFYSLAALFDVPNLFRDEEGRGLIYDYQVLFAGILALLAAMAIWVNTFIQEKIHDKRAVTLVTNYIEHQRQRAENNLKRVQDFLTNEAILKIALDEFQQLYAAPIFIENIKYLSGPQQKRCFELISIIDFFRNDSHTISNMSSLDKAKKVIELRLKEIIVVTESYLADRK